MGSIVDRGYGNQYTQPGIPREFDLGQLWWDKTESYLFGNNGYVWGAYGEDSVGVAGYYMLGSSFNGVVDKIVFATETFAFVSSAGTHMNPRDSGYYNEVRGYAHAGGTGLEGTYTYRNVNRVQFATDVLTDLGPIEPNLRCYSGTAQKPTAPVKGYGFGGGNRTDWPLFNDVTSLIFSTETVPAPFGTMSRARYSTGGESEVYAFANGGRWYGATSDQGSVNRDKMDFATETVVAISDFLFAISVASTTHRYNDSIHMTYTVGGGAYFYSMPYATETWTQGSATINTQQYGPQSRINGYRQGLSGVNTFRTEYETLTEVSLAVTASSAHQHCASVEYL